MKLSSKQVHFLNRMGWVNLRGETEGISSSLKSGNNSDNAGKTQHEILRRYWLLPASVAFETCLCSSLDFTQSRKTVRLTLCVRCQTRVALSAHYTGPRKVFAACYDSRGPSTSACCVVVDSQSSKWASTVLWFLSELQCFCICSVWNKKKVYRPDLSVDWSTVDIQYRGYCNIALRTTWLYQDFIFSIKKCFQVLWLLRQFWWHVSNTIKYHW